MLTLNGGHTCGFKLNNQTNTTENKNCNNCNMNYPIPLVCCNMQLCWKCWYKHCKKVGWDNELSACANKICDTLQIKDRSHIYQHNIKNILGILPNRIYNHISTKRRKKSSAMKKKIGNANEFNEVPTDLSILASVSFISKPHKPTEKISTSVDFDNDDKTSDTLSYEDTLPVKTEPMVIDTRQNKRSSENIQPQLIIPTSTLDDYIDDSYDQNKFIFEKKLIETISSYRTKEEQNLLTKSHIDSLVKILSLLKSLLNCLTKEEVNKLLENSPFTEIKNLMDKKFIEIQIILSDLISSFLRRIFFYCKIVDSKELVKPIIFRTNDSDKYIIMLNNIQPNRPEKKQKLDGSSF